MPARKQCAITLWRCLVMVRKCRIGCAIKIISRCVLSPIIHPTTDFVKVWGKHSGRSGSEQNADQTVAALVDDALQRLGKLFARFLWHMFQFGVQALVDQLVKRFSEHIRPPDAARIFLKFLQQILHHVLGLLLRSNHRADLGLNVRADHVNGLRSRA